MGARRIRREQRREDMATSRQVNGKLKTKERARRAVRMAEIIRGGKFPYTPPIMSWVSAQLGKPTRQITEADVQALVKE